MKKKTPKKDYDRWDTIPEAYRVDKPTSRRQKIIDDLNAQYKKKKRGKN